MEGQAIEDETTCIDQLLSADQNGYGAHLRFCATSMSQLQYSSALTSARLFCTVNYNTVV